MSDDHEQPSFDLAISVTKPLTPTESGFDLPLFDVDALCPKCGKDHASVVYHPSMIMGLTCSRTYWEQRSTLAAHSDFPEHFCRTCVRCRYGWVEAVLPPPQEDETQ